MEAVSTGDGFWKRIPLGYCERKETSYMHLQSYVHGGNDVDILVQSGWSCHDERLENCNQLVLDFEEHDESCYSSPVHQCFPLQLL